MFADESAGHALGSGVIGASERAIARLSPCEEQGCFYIHLYHLSPLASTAHRRPAS